MPVSTLCETVFSLNAELLRAYVALTKAGWDGRTLPQEIQLKTQYRHSNHRLSVAYPMQ